MDIDEVRCWPIMKVVKWLIAIDMMEEYNPGPPADPAPVPSGPPPGEWDRVIVAHHGKVTER